VRDTYQTIFSDPELEERQRQIIARALRRYRHCPTPIGSGSRPKLSAYAVRLERTSMAAVFLNRVMRRYVIRLQRSLHAEQSAADFGGCLPT